MLVLGITGLIGSGKSEVCKLLRNYGYLFSSGPSSWHGMEKKEIVNERRCLQVNYVTFKTDWKVED